MKINVAVFFGGKACEHEISCITAHQVLEALDTSKYNVIPLYIAKNGDFYTGEALFDLANYADLDTLKAQLVKVALYKDANKVYLHELKGGLFKAKDRVIDLAFLAMHGTNGEDGTLQGYLEMLGLPYTSSDVLGSALGQDKAIQKTVLAYNEIPLIPWFSFYVHDFLNDKQEYLAKALAIGYPLIIKPANLGSSIGIEVAHDEKEFILKVAECGNYDFKVVVEKLLTKFKELNCSVMGSVFKAEASPVEEVIKTAEILSFADKYLGSKAQKANKVPHAVKTPTKSGMAATTRKVPADISAEKTMEIQKLSLKAFKLLNAHGCVRVDFMLDESDGQLYLIEINSIPGSLAFYLWQAKGVSFTEECDRLIALARERARKKERMTFSFDTNILSNFRRKS